MAPRLRPDEGNGPAVGHAVPASDAYDRARACRSREAAADSARTAGTARLPADGERACPGARGRGRAPRRAKDASGMSVTVSRALVALAARSLGPSRRVWAEAMEAELYTAIEDDRPLVFATGCLLAAWRELPALPEGRLTLARHSLAIGLIVPVAGLPIRPALLG